MATVKYRNVGTKPLRVGKKVVKPGGTFSDKQANEAGVVVDYLLRAGQVRTVSPSRRSDGDTVGGDN